MARRRSRRRNPMPLTGAILVSNPRRRVRRSIKVRANMSNWMKKQYHAWKRGAGKSMRGKTGSRSAFFSSIAGAKASRRSARKTRSAKMALRKQRFGGMSRRAYKKSRKTRMKSARAAFSALPKNYGKLHGAARKSAYKKRSHKRAKSGRIMSPAQLAALAKGRAARKAGRSTSVAVRANGRRGRGRFSRRSSFRRNGVAFRRNSGIPGMGFVTGLVGRVPVIGGAVAQALPTAVLALVGGYVNNKFVAPYVAKYIPAQVSMLSGTLTGSAVAAAAKLGGRFLPASVQGIVNTVAAASVLAGVLSDLTNFAKGRGWAGLSLSGLSLGDGMAYELGGVATMSGVSAGEYGDAEYGDAYYSGPDLDSTEGDAALSGEYGWFGTFGKPPKRASGPRRPYSRHAGKQGHRWAWLIKLVGFQNFQKIVALPADRRTQVIGQLRQQALQSMPNLLAAPQPQGEQMSLSEELGYAGLMAVGGGF